MKKDPKNVSFSISGSSTRSKHEGGGASIGDDDLYESIYEVIRAPSESDFEEIQMENEGTKHKVSSCCKFEHNPKNL